MKTLLLDSNNKKNSGLDGRFATQPPLHTYIHSPHSSHSLVMNKVSAIIDLNIYLTLPLGNTLRIFVFTGAGTQYYFYSLSYFFTLCYTIY